MNVFLGSKASRIASPTNTKRPNIKPRVKKLVNPSHGACKLFLPWFTISPSEAEPGGSPKPKKSKPDNAVTEALKLKGRNVMVATVAFGNKCLSIILKFETPRALAART